MHDHCSDQWTRHVVDEPVAARRCRERDDRKSDLQNHMTPESIRITWFRWWVGVVEASFAADVRRRVAHVDQSEGWHRGADRVDRRRPVGTDRKGLEAAGTAGLGAVTRIRRFLDGFALAAGMFAGRPFHLDDGYRSTAGCPRGGADDAAAKRHHGCGEHRDKSVGWMSSSSCHLQAHTTSRSGSVDWKDRSVSSPT